MLVNYCEKSLNNFIELYKYETVIQLYLYNCISNIEKVILQINK